MFIVKKPFKSNGTCYITGQVLTQEDLEKIKFYKTKLHENKILILPKEDKELKALRNYFKEKYGIIIRIPKVKNTTPPRRIVKKKENN